MRFSILVSAMMFISLSAGAVAGGAGNWALISRKVGENSIADKVQLETVYGAVAGEINADHSDRESLTILNVKLKSIGLPVVRLDDAELKVKVARLIGFDSSSPVGVEVRDGEHRYCLPCEVGHNNFVVGIFNDYSSVQDGR